MLTARQGIVHEGGNEDAVAEATETSFPEVSDEEDSQEGSALKRVGI